MLDMGTKARIDSARDILGGKASFFTGERQTVAELDAERKLVEANRELIVRMERKMQARLAEVWGEEDDGK